MLQYHSFLSAMGKKRVSYFYHPDCVSHHYWIIDPSSVVCVLECCLSHPFFLVAPCSHYSTMDLVIRWNHFGWNWPITWCWATAYTRRWTATDRIMRNSGKWQACFTRWTISTFWKGLTPSSAICATMPRSLANTMSDPTKIVRRLPACTNLVSSPRGHHWMRPSSSASVKPTLPLIGLGDSIMPKRLLHQDFVTWMVRATFLQSSHCWSVVWLYWLH